MLKKSAPMGVVLLCALFLLNICQLTFAKEVNTQLQIHVKNSEALTPASLLPRQQLFQSSKIADVQLSPLANYLSYQEVHGTEHKKRATIWLFNIATKQHEKLFTAKGLTRMLWSANGQALFLNLGDSIAISKPRLNKTPIITIKLNPKNNDRLLGLDPSHLDSILVRVKDELTEDYVVYRINDYGKQQELYRTKQRFRQFEVDATGAPLYVTELNKAENSQGERNIFDIRGDQKKLIWQCQWDDPCSVYFYDTQQQRLLMKTNHQRNLSGLAWLELSSRKVTWLHSDPKNFADLAFVQYNGKYSTPEINHLVMHYRGDYVNHYAFDPIRQQHISALESQFPQQSLMLQFPPATQQWKKPWLVTKTADDLPYDQYYLYDPKSKKLQQVLTEKISQANSKQPLIAGDDIAPKHVFRYTARDGFELQGYITLPRGIEIKSAPLVVNPHGGPWSRTTDGYDKMSQLLANRGYIVFQPNFRASTGFGKKYEQGTSKDFGDGITQNDVIDGVHYLLNNDVGDKNRLAIFGHSFGGFSTLAGLTFTPNLFKVGFAGAPPSHMGRSVKFYHRFQKKTFREHNEYFMKKLVVDWHDKVAFDASYQNSPDNHVNQITKPLVLWAGEHDGRVFVVDVKDYALKAQALDKQISLFIDPKAKHSPNSKVGLQAYAYLLEKTLATHVKGAMQPLDKNKDTHLKRFLKKHMLIDDNQLITQ